MFSERGFSDVGHGATEVGDAGEVRHPHIRDCWGGESRHKSERSARVCSRQRDKLLFEKAQFFSCFGSSGNIEECLNDK